MFADQVWKVNRRLRIERRDLILSLEAFYIITRATKTNQHFYRVALRVPLRKIQEIAMSTLQDNFVVFVLPEEDIVISLERVRVILLRLLNPSKKTELLGCLVETYQKGTGKILPLRFSDSITYRVALGDKRLLLFVLDTSLDTTVTLKKTG